MDPTDSSPLLPHSPTPLIIVVDYCGCRITVRSTTGRRISTFFIIGVEVAERFAYYGISSNLITYLTAQLKEEMAAAAVAVNAWSGVSSLLPLIGGFIADSYLGWYRTIVIASLLYVVATLVSFPLSLTLKVHDILC